MPTDFNEHRSRRNLIADSHNLSVAESDNCYMSIQAPAQIRRCKSLPGCSALQIDVEIERPGVISAIQQTPKFFADDEYCFSRSSSNASVTQIQSEAEMNRLMAPVLERLKKEQWSYCDNLPLDSQIFLGLRDELGNKVE